MGKTPLAVTVAVLQPFPFVFRVEGGGPDPGTPWSRLRKTTVEARPDALLREVLRRACGPLGVTLEPEMVRSQAAFRAEQGLPPLQQDAADVLVYIAFRRPDDDQVIADHGFGPVLARDTRLRTTVLLVPDSQGRVVWRRPPFDATMAELLQAEKLGLLEGNPREIYLIPSIPQGDPGLAGAWQDFIDALKVLWDVTDGMARIGGALAFVLLLRDVARRRSREALEAIVRRAPEWQDRNGGPLDLLRFLAREPRTSAEVAKWLGCTADEANAMLWALGYIHDDETGCWLRCGDTTAQFLADDIDLTFYDAFRAPASNPRLEESVRERLRQLAETGEAPSVRDVHTQRWDLDEPGVDAMPSRSSFTRRVRGRVRWRRNS